MITTYESHMDNSVTIVMDSENDLEVFMRGNSVASVIMHYASERQHNEVSKVVGGAVWYRHSVPLHNIAGETRMRAKLITDPEGPADPSWAPTKVQWFDSPEALLLWIELSVAGRGT